MTPQGESKGVNTVKENQMDRSESGKNRFYSGTTAMEEKRPQC